MTPSTLKVHNLCMNCLVSSHEPAHSLRYSDLFLASLPIRHAAPSLGNHIVEPVGARPGFLAAAVGPAPPSSVTTAAPTATSWLFVFFLVNHFENLNSMET